MCKRRVGVIFGGRSDEHEVSCKSAAYVMNALDPDKFQPIYIGITKQGQWKLCKSPEDLERRGFGEDFAIDDLKEKVDFVLPVLHGPLGEDGTLQGLLEFLDIPYAGCGVFASALAMDKGIFKEFIKSKGLPVCRYLVFENMDIKANFDLVSHSIETKIGFPCFVKPANMGSSLGISKVISKSGLKEALNKAGVYDRKIVVEENLSAREIEVAVMGNHTVETSLPGEIASTGNFYDYYAKYSPDGEASTLMIPSKLPETICEGLRQLAAKAFKAIDGEGFARVDFFITEDDNRIYLNEINTIPGFTEKSMFPLLWHAQGKTPGEIIERIIDLGYERYYSKNCR